MSLTNEEVAKFFAEAPVRLDGNVNLRVPQIAGYDAARDYFAEGGHKAVEQIPVGCGKMGLITLLPFGIARGRVLVIAPNLTIKRQLRDALDVTSQECFYRKVGASWQSVFGRFPDARVLSLTATPFRSDDQPVEGEVIHRYTFRDAMQRGYIKDIQSVNVAPSEIFFTYRGDEARARPRVGLAHRAFAFTLKDRCVTPLPSTTEGPSSSVGVVTRWSKKRMPSPSSTGTRLIEISSISPAFRGPRGHVRSPVVAQARSSPLGRRTEP